MQIHNTTEVDGIPDKLRLAAALGILQQSRSDGEFGWIEPFSDHLVNTPAEVKKSLRPWWMYTHVDELYANQRTRPVDIFKLSGGDSLALVEAGCWSGGAVVRAVLLCQKNAPAQCLESWPVERTAAAPGSLYSWFAGSPHQTSHIARRFPEGLWFLLTPQIDSR